MADPLAPNYKRNVGRLVTDRYDFQNHVDGYSFRHEADQIDVSPSLTIDGYVTLDVQAALTALSGVLTPPVIADATSSVKGIIKLSGDLGGTADSVTVIGLRTYPVRAVAPTDGQVLTWHAAGPYWQPATAATAFIAGGDLTGTNISQQVIQITGNAGTLPVLCNNLFFSSSLLNPRIGQTGAASGDGTALVISAQNTASLSGRGGDVVITSGLGDSSGLEGSVKLATGDQNTIYIECAQLGTSAVLGLVHGGNTTISDMPAGTGNRVIYIRNAQTVPTTGTPSAGSILYATGGKLYVKHADTDQFQIGTYSNPSLSGATGQQTYISRSYVTSTTGNPTLAFSYSVPLLTSVMVEAYITGREVGGANSVQAIVVMGYTRDGSNPLADVGSVVGIDLRNTAGASSWTAPTITKVGNDIQVQSGYKAATTIRWYVQVKLTICGD